MTLIYFRKFKNQRQFATIYSLQNSDLNDKLGGYLHPIPSN
jgi:hypothetical protein